MTRKARWQTIGNDGTQSQMLSDGRFRKTRARPTFVRLHLCDPPEGDLANHWKQWDAKPEAKARDSALSPFGCMANRGKPWDAKPEAKGPLRLLGGSKLVRLPDTFASEYAKKGRKT